MRNVFVDWADAISSVFRLAVNEWYVVIPAIIIITMVLVSFGFIKCLFKHGAFCRRLKHFCKKHSLEYKSNFFKTLFKRRYLLGYTIRVSDKYTIQTFPYCCAKRTVHFFNDFQNVLIMKMSVQVKTEIGKGESNDIFLLNKTEHWTHQKKLPILPDDECVFYVLPLSPTQIYVTTNGIRQVAGSGHKAGKVILYEANEFIKYLNRTES